MAYQAANLQPGTPQQVSEFEAMLQSTNSTAVVSWEIWLQQPYDED
jgi:hypothetical protein